MKELEKFLGGMTFAFFLVFLGLDGLLWSLVWFLVSVAYIAVVLIQWYAKRVNR